MNDETMDLGQDEVNTEGWSEESLKYLKKLRNENKKLRLKAEELAVKYSGLEADFNELKEAKGKDDSKLTVKLEEKEALIKDIQSKLDTLQGFKQSVIEKKLSAIPDEKLREKLSKYDDIDLLDTMLERLPIMDSTPGTQNKKSDGLPDLKSMSVEDLNKFAQDDPQAFKKLYKEYTKL